MPGRIATAEYTRTLFPPTNMRDPRGSEHRSRAAGGCLPRGEHAAERPAPLSPFKQGSILVAALLFPPRLMSCLSKFEAASHGSF